MELRTKKMVVIITKRGGTTERQVVGDNLEAEERGFVFRDIEAQARRKGIL